MFEFELKNLPGSIKSWGERMREAALSARALKGDENYYEARFLMASAKQFRNIRKQNRDRLKTLRKLYSDLGIRL